jgi:hypothetical protein
MKKDHKTCFTTGRCDNIPVWDSSIQGSILFTRIYSDFGCTFLEVLRMHGMAHYRHKARERQKNLHHISWQIISMGTFMYIFRG